MPAAGGDEGTGGIQWTSLVAPTVISLQPIVLLMFSGHAKVIAFVPLDPRHPSCPRPNPVILAVPSCPPQAGMRGRGESSGHRK